MKVRWLFAVGLAACAAAYVIYTVKFPTYSHRFRLTLEVEVDGKVKSGSSVIEAVGWRTWAPGRGALFYDSADGNAVFVDLGDGRALVAILMCGPYAKTDCMPKLALHAFGFKGGPIDWRKMERQTGTVDLPIADFPTLITFRRPTDVTSARVVNPLDIAAELGLDARVVRLRLEMTNDPTSTDPRVVAIAEELRARKKHSILESPIFDARPGHFVR